ncbi:hypothetical protein KP509_12G061900 [Ceratopteris richardii]|uniref:Lipocalin/cytosolic fatty-acid binding domain-containing protein n=1 Tax=Ceratopteris richardii TaxID=49495 RepID=A0A8T2TP64_CERRI|nr:hypothetical protein KP509_12G061900 [Ceratopteris richardii]
MVFGKSKEPAMQVVKGVDLQRYQGKWYEIANIPSRFQPKGGRNTTATYALQPDGTVHVLNETWVDGKRASIEGKAWKADPNSDEAKLVVRFWVPPFLPVIPVDGDYWVMLLDSDYRWALVGQPSRNYLWVLSRTPELNEEVYSQMIAHAEQEGYDISKLKKTPHDDAATMEASNKAENDKGTWWLKSVLGK